MHADSLVRMANQIGDFFEAMPDRVEAMEGIAQHIRKFWEPRMRHEFLAYLDSTGTGALHPVVAEAVSTHRALLD